MRTQNWIITFISFAILSLLVSCTNRERTGSGADDTSGSLIRIMPLGNSITYGNYHPEPRPEGMITGYRQALWLMLKEAGYQVDFVGSRSTGKDAEPAFDPDNEGYPGWTDDQIRVNVYKWLRKNPADIIMLHIGTNGLDPDPSDVEGILDEIDRYERDYDHSIKVIMAKIINRSTYSQLTTQFNQNIEKMAIDRVIQQGDDIKIIDMEFETDIDYRLNAAGGEMFDNLHPFVGGHENMAVRWFEALQEVLPWPDHEPITISEPVLYTSSMDSDTRVRDGLIVLYDFMEGEGNLVHDVSGVGIPNDLYINHEGNVSWDPEQGLEIIREAILVPSDMNRKVTDSIMATHSISLEVWIRTGNMEQSGPAHMVSISDPFTTGISLSQDFEYENTAGYFFTRDSSAVLRSDRIYSSISLQHLVYTRDRDGVETLYINGEVAGTGQTEVDFSGWNPHTFKLSLCNSLGFENGWTGKLFLTAIYNRALAEDEVRQNYSAGKENLSIPPEVPGQPGKLSSTPLSAVATILHWEDLSQNETGFVLERKAAEGGFHYVATVPGDVTEYIDEDLVANSSYTYRIKALNDYGESLYSGESRSKTLSDDLLENVALLKTATQSSTTYKGRPSKGVDGNRDGIYINKSVTHTAYELNAWWEVDLEEIYYLDHMEVWNRTDPCCKDRMARFYIFISEDPFTSHDFQTTLDQPGVTAIYREFFPDPMITVNVAQRGRYIRLQLSDSQNINLAELVVMGSTPDNP